MQKTVPMKVAERVTAIEKRINDEPGFRVKNISLANNSPCHIFFMQVGAILVFSMIHVIDDLPHPDDVIASLRDEYDYALD